MRLLEVLHSYVLCNVLELLYQLNYYIQNKCGSLYARSVNIHFLNHVSCEFHSQFSKKIGRIPDTSTRRLYVWYNTDVCLIFNACQKLPIDQKVSVINKRPKIFLIPSFRSMQEL